MPEMEQPGARDLFLQAMNPLNKQTMAMEMKFQFMNRPSYWATAGVHGLRWPGMWGFRTLSAGLNAPFSTFGGAGSGPGTINRFINWSVNVPLGKMVRSFGRWYDSKNLRIGGAMRAIGQGMVSGHGILGAMETYGVPFAGGVRGFFSGTRRGILGVTGGGPGTMFGVNVSKTLGRTVGDDILFKAADEIGDITKKYSLRQIVKKGGFEKLKMESARSILKKFGLKPGDKGWDTLLKGFSSKFTKAAVVGGKIGAAASTVGNVLLVGTLMKFAATAAINYGARTVDTIVGAGEKLSGAGGPFGGGSLPPTYATRQATTMRQRALHELRTARIGSRSFLGNEAQMYAD